MTRTSGARSTRVRSAVAAHRAPHELQADVPDDLPRDVFDTALRTAFGHISGVWAIRLNRLYERDRWRLELRGATGRHIWIFVAPADSLADMVRRKLVGYVRSSTAKYLRRVALAVAP